MNILNTIIFDLSWLFFYFYLKFLKMSNVPYSFKSSSNSLTITSDPSICSGFSPIFLNLKHFETLSATVSVLGIPVAADYIFIKSSKCTGVDSTDTINEVIAIITSNASG